MQEPWLVALQLFVRVRKFISIYVVLLAKYSYYKGLKMVFAAGCISLLCQWCCSHQYCWSESPQYWGWCRGEVSMTRFAFWLLDFCWAFYLLSLVLFLFLFFFPLFVLSTERKSFYLFLQLCHRWSLNRSWEVRVLLSLLVVDLVT